MHRSNATSVTSAGGRTNTINLTAAEKKALRDEADRKKKAAKKRKAEQERQRRLAEEAERARIAGPGRRRCVRDGGVRFPPIEGGCAFRRLNSLLLVVLLTMYPAALEFLRDRASAWSPWDDANNFALDLRGFVSGIPVCGRPQ